jgi:hypothetical protein
MKKLHLRDGAKDPGSTSLRWLLLVPFIILLSLAATLYRHEHNQQQTTDHNNTTKASETKNTHNTVKNIRSYVKVSGNDYEHSRLGGISNLKISVINSSDFLLDKVRVKLTYIKANGSVWDTRYEDFYLVKSNTSITHDIPDTKRGTSVEYSIVSIKSKALGL